MDAETKAQASSSPATAADSSADNASTSQPDLTEIKSLDQLDQLFTKGSLELPAKAGDGGEKVSAETTAAEPAKAEPEPTGDEPAAEPDPEPIALEESEDEKKEVERIQRPRLKNPIDQQIAAVFKAAETAEAPISWAEAERRVKGDPAPTPTTTETPATAASSEGLEILRGEVAELQAKLDEATGEEGVLYTKELRDLQSQLEDKKFDLKLAQRDQARKEETVSQQRAEARGKAKAKAIAKFPDAANPASPLGKAVAARIEQLKKSSAPVLFDDDAPYYIVRDVADELGIAPAAEAKASEPATKATPSPATPAPATRTVVSPPSGAKTSAPPIAANPQAEKAKTVDYLKTEATLDELDKVFMPDGSNNLLFAVAGR